MTGGLCFDVFAPTSKNFALVVVGGGKPRGGVILKKYAKFVE
jgi:hypothetical protein